MRDEIRQANYRTLLRTTQVDPHQWMAGGRCFGWEFEFWSVAMRVPGSDVEQRLVAVSVRDRDMPGHRQWLEAFDAVARSIEACATVAYGEGRFARVDLSPLRVDCCGVWADECRHEFDAFAGDAVRASLRVEIATGDGDVFSLDDEQPALHGTLAGIDTADGTAPVVEVTAVPLGPLSEVDEAQRDYARRDFAVHDDSDELWELAKALGKLVDEWCPIRAAAAVPAQWADGDVAVRATDTDQISVTLVAEVAGRDRVWWCRWCENQPFGTFVVGDALGGVACCEAHIGDAVEFELQEMAAAV